MPLEGFLEPSEDLPLEPEPDRQVPELAICTLAQRIQILVETNMSDKLRASVLRSGLVGDQREIFDFIPSLQVMDVLLYLLVSEATVRLIDADRLCAAGKLT